MTKDSGPPPAKKPKVTEGLCPCCDGGSYGDCDGDGDGKVVNDLVDTAWEHYRNYLDSESKEDDGDHTAADIDELYELIDIVKPHITDGPQSCIADDASVEDTTSATWTSRRAMLPILLSVVYNHLADAAIAEFFSLEQQNRDGGSNQDPSFPASLVAQERAIVQKVRQLLSRSLSLYPHNAAVWSTGANFGRITQTLDQFRTRQWYERAVQAATTLRKTALTVLESDEIPDEVKEWIELLILNQILGVEYVEDEDDEDDDDVEQEEVAPIKKTKSKPQSSEPDAFEDEFDEEQQRERDELDAVRKGEAFLNEYIEAEDDTDIEEVEEDSGQYSSSAVESTARFMCAMLWSMEGSHDRALVHLKHFPLTHRLHPNVWRVLATSTTTPVPPPTKAPVVFQPSDGILPSNLYIAMTKLFAPEAAYWSESDYANRGYYSFFMDHDEEGRRHSPRNLLEEVIVHHLFPRAQQVLDMEAEKNVGEEGCDDIQEPAPKICGFEWWAHTRPIEANLGHNLHFDTDEALLDQEGKVTHPILSSVLYLTGADSQPVDSISGSVISSPPSSPPAGATIILDQTPDSETVASICWQGIPKDNSLLIFPGDRLHGVLPCPGRSNMKDDDKSPSRSASQVTVEELIEDWKDLEPDTSDVSSSTSSRPHRLTFMVGFWTRNVPATMKVRDLYGPCGPLPPNTDEHTWVKELTKGYDTINEEERPIAPKTMPVTSLPCVSPAWERFDPNDDVVINTDVKKGQEGRSNGEHVLPIPHAIDHRFFVRGAPHCFRDSLFEDRAMDC